jgi:hypothetical protein
MQSKKINELGTNLAPSINDLTVVGDAATGQLKKITLNQIASLFGSVGGVSSVAMTVPTGLTVTGSPITTSGTLAVTLTAGYSIPTTAKQTEWDAAFADKYKWDGGASGLTASTGRTSLGATTIGSNLFTLTNPSAVTFLRVNADNTISALDAATFRTAIGAGTSSTTGTVTSVAALTLGTTGTDISSSVATGTTTPVITLNIPTASAANRGALSSTDWTTFNNKQNALGFTPYNSTNPDGFITSSGTAAAVSKTVTGTNTAELVRGNMADNDQFRILIGGTGTNSGYVEIATADDGTEPIYVRQYTGEFSTLTRTATLLDGSGNTSFPNNLSAANFSGSSSGTNTGDQTLAGLGGQPQLNGTGFVKASGTSISYDNSTYLTTSSAASTYLTISTASSTYLPLSGGTISGTLTVNNLLTNYNVYNTQTSSYTLVLSDASKIIDMNVGSANTVTVPNNSSVAFPIGTEITVMQYGAGNTTIVAASGVTFRSKDFSTRIGDQYTGATLIKRDTNEWYLIGNIQP